MRYSELFPLGRTLASETLILDRLNGLAVKECFVNVTAGEARSKEFVRINPLAKIPCLKVPKLYSSIEGSRSSAPS